MNSRPEGFSSYQKSVAAILAFLNFTVVLDFMILSPLGAQLMPALQISPVQFGVLVSTYAFAATITLVASTLSGLLVRRRLDELDLVSVLKSKE